jgi:hypothetical protein
LSSAGIPWALVRIIGMLAVAGRVLADDRPLECIEYFAGVSSIVQAFRELGLSAYAYDIKQECRFTIRLSNRLVQSNRETPRAHLRNNVSPTVRGRSGKHCRFSEV